MERMMDGGSGGYGSDPMSSGSEMGMPGGEHPARKPATPKKAGAGGKKRSRKKASKARGRAKGKARGKAGGRTRSRAKKGSRKARRR